MWQGLHPLCSPEKKSIGIRMNSIANTCDCRNEEPDYHRLSHLNSLPKVLHHSGGRSLAKHENYDVLCEPSQSIFAQKIDLVCSPCHSRHSGLQCQWGQLPLSSTRLQVDHEPERGNILHFIILCKEPIRITSRVNKTLNQKI